MVRVSLNEKAPGGDELIMDHTVSSLLEEYKRIVIKNNALARDGDLDQLISRANMPGIFEELVASRKLISALNAMGQLDKIGIPVKIEIITWDGDTVGDIELKSNAMMCAMSNHIVELIAGVLAGEESMELSGPHCLLTISRARDNQEGE
jgi:hypothetical protein